MNLTLISESSIQRLVSEFWLWFQNSTVSWEFEFWPKSQISDLNLKIFSSLWNLRILRLMSGFCLNLRTKKTVFDYIFYSSSLYPLRCALWCWNKTSTHSLKIAESFENISDLSTVFSLIRNSCGWAWKSLLFASFKHVDVCFWMKGGVEVY